MNPISSVNSVIQATPSQTVSAPSAGFSVDLGTESPKPSVSRESTRTESASPIKSQAAREDKESNSDATRVSLSQDTVSQPNTANRNASPIEQFKAVSALR